MNEYELTFLTTEDADPGIAAVLEGLGGRISTQKSLGRRPLAYPIKKETAAYYTTLRFTIESEALPQLTKQLALMPGLLRYLVVDLPAAATAKPSLEVDEALQEAKDLDVPTEEASATPKSVEPQATKAETAERDKKLQAQLDKLLAGDENETEGK